MLQKNVQVNRKILATPTVQRTIYIIQYTLIFHIFKTQLRYSDLENVHNEPYLANIL